MSKKGIDISIWQSNYTDFSNLKSNGYDFAILKISEGQSVDRAFEQHYANCGKYGIARGVYVYSHANTVAKAVNEANFLLGILKGRKLELPIFIDLESDDINFSWNHDITEWALAFGNTIKQAGYRWGTYANQSWYQNKLNIPALRAAGATIWCAAYGFTPIIDHDIHQYNDRERINGYSSNLDANLLYNDTLIDYDGIGITPPIDDFKPIEPSTSKPMLQRGSKGQYVIELQSLLNSVDNAGLDIDGDFGYATYNAVLVFQRKNSLEVDGIVGKSTWKALINAKAEDEVPEIPEKPEIPDVPAGTCPLLRFGSKGIYVKEAQQLLIKKGYNCGAAGADGDFGAGTFNAVQKFQRDNHLEADGEIGDDTWKVLLSDVPEVKPDPIPEPEPDPTPIIPPIAPPSTVFDPNVVINVARAEVGYLEKRTNEQLDDKTANAGYNNWNKYARDIDTLYPAFYNGKKNGYAWCDCFVDWCFIRAYGIAAAYELLCAPERSLGAGCSYSANYYRRQGRFFKYGPQRGDQIFFGESGNEGHTGLVYDVDDRNVYTIEGNTNGTTGVVANGGGVFMKQYPLNSYSISGYGRPDYARTGGSSSVSIYSAQIRSFQSWLNSVYHTNISVDGEWGPSTRKAAIKAFQNLCNENIKTNLVVDGDWGPATYAAAQKFAVRSGMTGNIVRLAQGLLYCHGVNAGGFDGIFGSGCFGAVKTFQQMRSISNDGIIGGTTWKVLLA